MYMVPKLRRPLRGPPVPTAVSARMLLLAAILTLTCAQIVSAQHVRGRLIDLETNQPIVGGVLTLLTTDSAVVATAVSDSAGRWLLPVPDPGVYHVAAERIGYAAMISEAVEIGPDDALDSVFHLEATAVELDPIEVEVRAAREYLEYSGFFERQKANFGHFVTPEAIDRRQAARVTDLLASVPGVRIVSSGTGSVGPSEVQMRGSSLSQGGNCRPRVFVDGLMYNRGDSRPIYDREGRETDQLIEDPLREDHALSLDDIGHPSIIAGIEVYRSASQVPVQFGGTSIETLCGVIVVWTRTGQRRGGEA